MKAVASRNEQNRTNATTNFAKRLQSNLSFIGFSLSLSLSLSVVYIFNSRLALPSSISSFSESGQSSASIFSTAFQSPKE